MDEPCHDIRAAAGSAGYRYQPQPRALENSAEERGEELVARVGRHDRAEDIERRREYHRDPERASHELPAEEYPHEYQHWDIQRKVHYTYGQRKQVIDYHRYTRKAALSNGIRYGEAANAYRVERAADDPHYIIFDQLKSAFFIEIHRFPPKINRRCGAARNKAR